MIEDLQKRLHKKCDWFDILFTEGGSTPLSFRNNEIYSIRERQTRGYGLRVNVNRQTGFSYTNETDNVESIIDNALAMAKKGDVEEFQLPADTIEGYFEPFSDEIEGYDLDAEIGKGEEAISFIQERYPDIKIDLSISGASGSKRIVNSMGFDGGYRFSYYSASLIAKLIMENGVLLEIWEGLTDLKPVDFHFLADTILKKLDWGVQINRTRSGGIPVVFTPKAFASMLSILKTGLSAKSVYRGISPFAEKLGKRSFNESFSLMDRPLLHSAYGFPFDDEGVAARDKVLIDGGVVKQFISDLKFANKLGMEPSGNASRSYSSLPVPSFSNTVVPQGDVPSSDIIGSIKHGILIDQFIGLGQSNTLTGQFSANLDLAYLIDGGEITGRVKDCMISDNFFELLSGEMQLSSDSEQIGSSLVPYLYFPSVQYTG
jgi:PmbA protein